MSSPSNNSSVENQDLPESGINSENFDVKSDHENPSEQQQQHPEEPEDDRQSLSSVEGCMNHRYTPVKLI
jgi:hypothetical protein